MVVAPSSAVVEYSLFTRIGGFLSDRLVRVDTASRPGQSPALFRCQCHPFIHCSELEENCYHFFPPLRHLPIGSTILSDLGATAGEIKKQFTLNES